MFPHHPYFTSLRCKMTHLSCFLFFALSLLTPKFVSSMAVQAPERVVQDVQRSINVSRRNLSSFSCRTGNPIDDCWRCEPNWASHRQKLADCAIGFGKLAVGGRNGRIYVVTESDDNNPNNPKPGTLRHAVTQHEPLWIVFKKDMNITLKEELVMNSFKTIDGRGVRVHITGGGCIMVHFTSNIIIHGIHIHDCDNDGISILNSKHIWVDHCSLSKCHDGLIDATHGSTGITISNNYMTHHDKVMLLGHSESYTKDKEMQITIAFNHFGEGLVQRMPRCRHGFFHVVNNDYTHWEMYAIGGSANPTINSQGNRFLAPNVKSSKEVTKREDAPENEWKQWNWRSEGDMFLNGAFFRESGAAGSSSYSRASSLSARPSSLVGSMTQTAGALSCGKGSRC